MIKPEYPLQILAKELYKNPAHEYVEAKITSKPNEIQLNCPDEVSFRSIQSFLVSIQEKVSYHTHSLASQRTLKIVINGIPLNISDQEISEELKAYDFEPTFIRAFTKNGQKIPIHMLTLTNIYQAKEIYHLTKLFFVNVKIEPYRL